MTKEEAISYAGCRESKIRFQVSTPIMPAKTCLVCEKPYKGKTKLCPTCNKLRKTASYSMSVRTAVAIKQLNPDADMFSLVQDSPSIITRTVRSTTSQERAELRKQRSAELRSEEYQQAIYTKETINIPDYITRLLSADKTKTLLYLEGSRTNPKIYYFCQRCEQEQCQTYESLKNGLGHNCPSLKSSGEVIVENFLKDLEIVYKTQYKTLKCVNPITQKVMPYDFELPKHRIIIEVQGNQHLQFEPYFHGSVENFEYQIWKDRYKKEYAEQHGYAVVYVDYEDLETDRYKTIILKNMNREL